ncbi:GNAT family N-acetyltransferase [bacterium]|nr:GNAT family N-acetyltransferase [bacterium]
MEIRKISKAEREQFIDLEFMSFGEKLPKKIDEELLQFADPAYTFGAFDNGEIMAGLRNLPLLQSVRGVLKKMGGVACVATYPEYRGQGIVLPLMKAAFEDMRAVNQSVSMLAAFKQSFYDKFDYVPIKPAIFLNVPRQSFKKYRFLPKDNSWELQRIYPDEGKKEFFGFMKEIVSGQYHGSVIYENISQSEWKYNNKNTTMLFVRRHGRLEAVARARCKGFMEDGELILEDMFWRDLPARDRLFQFIGLYWDQAYRIKLQVPNNCNFFHWFSDPETLFKSTIPSAPFMVRIIDPVEAFRDIPVPIPGQFTYKLLDPLIPANNRTISLNSNNGVLQAEPVDDPTATEVPIKGLTALLYGTTDIEELIHCGFLPEFSSETKALLKAWFPQISGFSNFDY